MKRSAILLVTTLCFFTGRAIAQTPAIALPATTDSVEGTEEGVQAEFKMHHIEVAEEKIKAQRQLDSLFRDHEEILGVIKETALKDWESAKAADAQTLKELREEEIALRKELREEEKRSEGWLRSKTKRSFNKTKYEVEQEEE